MHIRPPQPKVLNFIFQISYLHEFNGTDDEPPVGGKRDDINTGRCWRAASAAVLNARCRDKRKCL